jgi:hypothetical protein
MTDPNSLTTFVFDTDSEALSYKVIEQIRVLTLREMTGTERGLYDAIRAGRRDLSAKRTRLVVSTLAAFCESVKDTSPVTPEERMNRLIADSRSLKSRRRRQHEFRRDLGRVRRSPPS